MSDYVDCGHHGVTVMETQSIDDETISMEEIGGYYVMSGPQGEPLQ